MSQIPKIVSTITPQRISFVGGGTDLPKYFTNNTGAVVSCTIDKYIYVTVKRHSPLFQEAYRLSYSTTEHVQSLDEMQNDIARECIRLVPVDGPLYISTAADLPASSGLGSSSCFAVGLLNALHAMNGEVVSPGQLAEEACDVEIKILKNPIGKQDQYAAAFGGLNHIHFSEDGRVMIDQLVPKFDLISLIFKNSFLVWTGIQRSASTVLQQQNSNIDNSLDAYKDIASLTRKFKNLLINDSEDQLVNIGAFLEEGWRVKKTLESSISSSKINEIHDRIFDLGGLGGKLCGAGGGGFLFEIIPGTAREKIIEEFGVDRLVTINYEPLGSRILYQQY